MLRTPRPVIAANNIFNDRPAIRFWIQLLFGVEQFDIHFKENTHAAGKGYFRE